MQSDNRRYFKIGRHTIFVGVVLILTWFFIENLDFFWGFTVKVYNILTPFVYGFVFAYLLKPVVNWLEKYVFIFVWKKPNIKKEIVESNWIKLINKKRRNLAITKVMKSADDEKQNKKVVSLENAEKISSLKKKLDTYVSMYLSESENDKETVHQQKIKEKAYTIIEQKLVNERSGKRKNLGRVLSIITTYLIVFAAIAGFGIILVPGLIDSVEALIDQVPALINKLGEWAEWLRTQNMATYIDIPTVDELTTMLEGYKAELTNFASNTIPWLMTQLVAVTNGIIDGIIGLVVSIYMLKNKETFAEQVKKAVCAMQTKKNAQKTVNIARMIDDSFGGYISSRIITSIFIGIICYIGMKIFKMPYAALISVIIGVTNLLPYVGPFIGGIPAAIMILVIDPIKAVIFVIFITVLQQLEGNIISVLITGKKTGMSGFWVMFSVMLGGGLFGVWGMFIGVPFFAVFYALSGENMREKLIKKGCTGDVDEYLNSSEQEENK